MNVEAIQQDIFCAYPRKNEVSMLLKQKLFLMNNKTIIGFMIWRIMLINEGVTD